MIIPINERTMKNELYQRLKRVHYGMMSRCYNESNISYPSYGAKGVRVWEGWRDFEGFLSTVDQVEGWDESRYVIDKLALDKDKIPGNKLYSPKTCRFVTPAENNETKPNQQYKLVGYSPEKELYRFHSAHGFAKRHNLNYYNIIKCAKGETIAHKGWQFCMEEEYQEGIFVEPYSWHRYIIGLAPTGEQYRFYNASQFARDHDLLEATVIYACANGKVRHTAFWQFRFETEVESSPFLSQEDLRRPANTQWIIATSPDGEEFEFWNRAEFARQHNLNKGNVSAAINGKQSHHKGWTFRFKR
jgi:hypothetical protein